jgi:hypothetical protein
VVLNPAYVMYEAFGLPPNPFDEKTLAGKVFDTVNKVFIEKPVQVIKDIGRSIGKLFGW